MKDNTYRKAVDHLAFSDELYEKVLKHADTEKRRFRPARTLALIAAVVALLGTSVFAVGAEWIERRVNVVELGTAADDMQDAEVMKFTTADSSSGVKIHYLELERNRSYSFANGMLYSKDSGFYRITEDYQLEPVNSEIIKGTLEKNGMVYQIEFRFVDTEEGIISTHKSVYQKNEKGEILLNASDTEGKSNQWPVYVNPDTGEIRDALPGRTADDFEGRVGYGEALWDGILISTVISENETVNGSSVSYNGLYWINEETSEVTEIKLPNRRMLWYVQNDTFYYRNGIGKLYCMDRNFQSRILSNYRTGDDLTGGLLTVPVSGKAGILDVHRQELYLIEDLAADSDDFDETMGYNASRYSPDGRIALVHTGIDWERGVCRIDMIGILDQKTGQMKLLEIENQYDGYYNHWLDEDRYGVIYESHHAQKYLCIYEFE